MCLACRLRCKDILVLSTSPRSDGPRLWVGQDSQPLAYSLASSSPRACQVCDLVHASHSERLLLGALSGLSYPAPVRGCPRPWRLIHSRSQPCAIPDASAAIRSSHVKPFRACRGVVRPPHFAAGTSRHFLLASVPVSPSPETLIGVEGGIAAPSAPLEPHQHD